MSNALEHFDHDAAVYAIAETVRKCDDDIIGEGCAWYDGYAQGIGRQIAREANVTENVALFLISVRNINASWAGGITRARRDAHQWHKWVAMVARGVSNAVLERAIGGLKACKRAIRRALRGERYYATLAHMPKIGRFYRNLAIRDHEVVTVDRWAARACGFAGNPDTPRVYDAIERAYQDAAHEVGLPPAMVQAIVWIVVRGSGE